MTTIGEWVNVSSSTSSESRKMVVVVVAAIYCEMDKFINH